MKTFKKIFFIIVGAGTFAFGSLLFFIMLNYGNETTQQSDCIVVFGASVAPGAKPSRAIVDRVAKASTLYKSGLSNCLVLSGAPSVFGAHEVDVMKKEAIKNGVKKEDIKTDYQGLSTFETLVNLDKNKNYIFVSNDFHLARIAITSKLLELKGETVSSDYKKGTPKDELQLVLREAVAIVYYVARIFALKFGII